MVNNEIIIIATMVCIGKLINLHLFNKKIMKIYKHKNKIINNDK